MHPISSRRQLYVLEVGLVVSCLLQLEARQSSSVCFDVDASAGELDITECELADAMNVDGDCVLLGGTADCTLSALQMHARKVSQIPTPKDGPQKPQLPRWMHMPPILLQLPKLHHSLAMLLFSSQVHEGQSLRAERQQCAVLLAVIAACVVLAVGVCLSSRAAARSLQASRGLQGLQHSAPVDTFAMRREGLQPTNEAPAPRRAFWTGLGRRSDGRASLDTSASGHHVSKQSLQAKSPPMEGFVTFDRKCATLMPAGVSGAVQAANRRNADLKLDEDMSPTFDDMADSRATGVGPLMPPLNRVPEANPTHGLSASRHPASQQRHTHSPQGRRSVQDALRGLRLPWVCSSKELPAEPRSQHRLGSAAGASADRRAVPR